MSEKQIPENAADVPVQGGQNPAPQPNFSQPIIIERKHNNGRGLATGALALSVMALGASGFLFVQGQNIFRMQEIKVHQELDKAALGESENARKLASSLDEQQKINTLVGQLDVGQRENRKHLADIQRAYQELLKGRVNWLVDEIEVTLNLAAQQLVLSGNVPVAVGVLETIEQRLSRFEQAELLPIKRAVSQDLAVLKQNAGAYADISGMVLKLDALEKAVAGLPLLVDNTLQAQNAPAAPVAESADFWTRAWNKTVNLLHGMVEIRKLDSNDAMLLSPEQVYFVRANLRLRLLDARLALMQHNGESYKNQLAEVEGAVKTYFDTAAPTTKKWLDDLAQLNAQNLSIVSDDVLKDSLAAVRDYQNKTRTAVPVNLKPVEELPAVVLGAAMAVAEQAAEARPQAASQVREVSAASSAATAAPPQETDGAAKVVPAASEASSGGEASVPAEKKADSLGKPQTGKQRALGLTAPAAVLTASAESASAEPVKSESAEVLKAAAPAAAAVAAAAAVKAAAGRDEAKEAADNKAQREAEARKRRERARAEHKERRRREREAAAKREEREQRREARAQAQARPKKRDEAGSPSRRAAKTEAPAGDAAQP
ncbi:uroporphyrinogen-III C-methyltransferase [Conchiformibius kuhniae]|uniref:Uroporphyrinogen-III C-methyltransferase n=1 Tax=Conchiformibius kuhniae TaxID=211502 RepID=A0A8T9MWC3_9NEIS|nr:uroporphyrinogen-III C-methyltransferase [Conchiformibius kuhniae]